MEREVSCRLVLEVDAVFELGVKNNLQLGEVFLDGGDLALDGSAVRCQFLIELLYSFNGLVFGQQHDSLANHERRGLCLTLVQG